MFTVVVKDKFDAAHHLPGVPVCERIHGHTFQVEVSVSAKELNDKGMVIDFRDIKTVTSGLYDHDDLNKFFDMPTAENLAKFMFYALKKNLCGQCIDYVRIWESSDAYAEYSE